MNCISPGFSVHGIFPGKNTGVGSCFLLQGIFLTQGPNLCLLHWQVDSLPLSHHTLRILHRGNSLAAQGLGLLTFTNEGWCSIPGWGTKTPQVAQCSATPPVSVNLILIITQHHVQSVFWKHLKLWKWSICKEVTVTGWNRCYDWSTWVFLDPRARSINYNKQLLSILWRVKNLWLVEQLSY